MTNDLTRGEPLALIVKFAIPVILGNLFQQIYNMADAMIVGRCLGVNSLSAVSASTSVNFLILGFCIGICSGFSIPVAQQFGAENLKEMRRYSANAYVLCVFFALSVTLATSLLCDNILNWIHTPDLIRREAYIYQLIIFLGIPVTISYNIFASMTRSVGDSRTPFICLLVSAALNVVMDFAFILFLGLGVAGAAIATVLSQAFSALLCLFLMLRNYPTLRLSREDLFISRRYIRRLLRIGVPMGLQSSITAVGSIMLQFAVNSIDTLSVGAYALALKIKALYICPYDSMGTAMATYTGQNLGAGKYDRITEGIRKAVAACCVVAVLSCLSIQLFGYRLTGLFITDEPVRLAATRFLRITSCFYFVLAFLCVYRYSLQGLGKSSLSMLSGLMEMVARTSMSFFVIPVFGFNAVCFTDQSAWISAMIVSMSLFYLTFLKMRKRTSPEL